MKIAHLRISNILGVKDLEFSPAAGFTEIAGPNGAGKTSVLEAIKATLECGHDATLLRKGEEKGEVVLVLDDGTEIRRRVGQNTTTTDLIRDGKKVPRPAEAIKALTDMLSVNPIDFLRAPKKDRVSVLLEALPMQADPAKLEAIVGAPVKFQPGAHALHVIDATARQIYDDRTGLNRAIKEKEATVSQLSQAMPDAPGGIEGNEADLQAQVETATAARDTELERIRTKLASVTSDHNAAVAKLKDEAQAQIDAIRAKLATDVEAATATFADIERRATTQQQRTVDKFREATDPVRTALASIRQNRDVAAKREQQQKLIDQMVDDVDELREDADAKSRALTGLEAYKSELLSKLPVDGLEVVDGEIKRNGVLFDRLNTAQQVDIAVEIAKLRAGQLGVVCVDNIELLDKASFETFRERAIESGLQMFVSRVLQEGEFTVNTDE